MMLSRAKLFACVGIAPLPEADGEAADAAIGALGSLPLLPTDTCFAVEAASGWCV